MEIIKSTFLQQNNKKVFVILCLHEDEPFLEGEIASSCRNSFTTIKMINFSWSSLLEEDPSEHPQSR